MTLQIPLLFLAEQRRVVAKAVDLSRSNPSWLLGSPSITQHSRAACFRSHAKDDGPLPDQAGGISDPALQPNPARHGPVHAFLGDVARTPDELFDVVDERDQVVRQAPRREVHAQGWLHRAVHVLVFNRAGQVFLQKRSMTKDMSPGLWDSSCSGHLDAGEDYDAAAWRELQEEIGLKLPQPPPRWLRVEACEATGQEFVWVYRLESEGPFTLCPDEIERGEWIAPDELNRRIAARPQDYCSAFRLIWDMIQV